jgi:hypothetical protein
MAGVRVDELGTKGVNLVVAPLEMDDSEVAQAQNAEPYQDRGVAGIRKRPAFKTVNTIATDAIKGMVAVELDQSGGGNNLGTVLSGTKGLILVAYNVAPGTHSWRQTIDGGTTWTANTRLTHTVANANQ